MTAQADRADPAVRLRLGRAADATQLVELTKVVAGEGRWIGRELPIDEELSHARYVASVDAPGHHTLLAVVDDPDAGPGVERVVGHLHLGVTPYGVADLGMLLARDHRGQGVGRRMMDEAIAWAQAAPDVHKLELQVWPHNAAAIALYRRVGFVQEGYLVKHYRRRSGELWDAVVMGLLL